MIGSTGHHHSSGGGFWGDGNCSVRIDGRKMRNRLLARVSQTCWPNVLSSGRRLDVDEDFDVIHFHILALAQ